MNIRLNLATFRFFMSLSRYSKVTGVNSKLPGGKHVLFWDFDNVDEAEITLYLTEAQKKWKLPKIYLVNTGIDGYFHAYCFKAVDWGTCLHILANTPKLDQMFFRIGVIRGYFTLRYTKKLGREFKPATILPSKYPETINPFELCSFITYDTKRR